MLLFSHLSHQKDYNKPVIYLLSKSEKSQKGDCMSYFSEMLTFYSKRIGVNSPQIASFCNLDRVTVYRFMKGKTLPKDRNTVVKMAEFLQLTTEERETLAEAYEYTRLGAHTYLERRYIRSFIKSFSGTIPITPLIQFDTDQLQDLQGETLVLSGKDQTLRRIQMEILRESEKPGAEISLRMSACINIIMDLLLAAGRRNSGLKVNHLIPVATASVYEKKDPRADNDSNIPNASFLSLGDPLYSGFSTYSLDIPAEADSRVRAAKISGNVSSETVWIGNHELLQNIFKVVRLCSEEFDYQPSYYYTHQEESGQFPVYSNLLITGSSVILFTDDLKESIVMSDPVFVTLFLEKFQNLTADKPKLFFFFRDIRTLIENAQKTIIHRQRMFEETEYYYSSLPCLLPILTDNILERHISMELIAKMQGRGEDSLKCIYGYVESIRKLYTENDYNEVVLFSEGGLRSFMQTGRISDVPPELYSPLTEPERRQMLLTLADHPNLRYHVLKKELSAPEGMLGIQVMDNALFMTFYNAEKGMCYLYINEPGVLLAFRNFFKNLSAEEVYSNEESREIVRAIAQRPL